MDYFTQARKAAAAMDEETYRYRHTSGRVLWARMEGAKPSFRRRRSFVFSYRAALLMTVQRLLWVGIIGAFYLSNQSLWPARTSNSDKNLPDWTPGERSEWQPYHSHKWAAMAHSAVRRSTRRVHEALLGGGDDRQNRLAQHFTTPLFYIHNIFIHPSDDIHRFGFFRCAMSFTPDDAKQQCIQVLGWPPHEQWLSRLMSFLETRSKVVFWLIHFDEYIFSMHSSKLILWSATIEMH
jgi:hypothetical protein